MSNQSANTTAMLVKGLGGASLGLGLSELVAPAKVAALAGVDDTRRSRPVIRALGLRECGHAAALLFGSARMVGTRVAGDALDLALLGAAVCNRGQGRRGRGAMSAVALVGIAADDLYAALRSTRGGGGRHGRNSAGAPHRTLRAAVTVWRPPEDVYRAWRQLHGDVQITEDEPNSRIAWQPLPGSAVEHIGSVEFTAAPGGDSTEVRVTSSYRLPAACLAKRRRPCSANRLSSKSTTTFAGSSKSWKPDRRCVRTDPPKEPLRSGKCTSGPGSRREKTDESHGMGGP